MTMTPKEQTRAQDLLSSGVSAEGVANAIKESRLDAQEYAAVYKAPTVGGAFTAGVERYKSGQERIQQRAEVTESVPEALLGGLAAPLTAIGSAVGAVGTTAFGLVDVATDGGLGRTLQPVVQTVADIEIGDETIGSGISKLNQLTGGALEDTADIAALMGFGAGTKGLITQARKVKVPEIKSLKDFMSPKKDVAIGASASEKLATEILQVPKRELKEYVKRGEIHPAVEAAVVNIKKVDSFDEWIGNLQTIVKDDFKRLDDIIKKDNFDIDETYLLKLDDYIASEAKTGFRTPSEIATMQKVRDSSLGVLAEGGGKISRAEAQIVKKRLNKIVGPLQKKNELGTITTTESARLTALDKLRAGLKEAIEGGDKAVESINAKYKGLSKAIDFLASREALARKAVEPTMLQKIAAPVIELISASTGAGSAAFVGRQALQMEKRLDTLTSRLKKLAEKEGKIKTEKAVSKGDKPATENIKEQTPKKEPHKSQSKDQSQTDSGKDVSSVNNTLKTTKSTGNILDDIDSTNLNTLDKFLSSLKEAGNSPATVKEIIEGYSKISPKFIEQIQQKIQAISKDDLVTIYRVKDKTPSKETVGWTTNKDTAIDWKETGDTVYTAKVAPKDVLYWDGAFDVKDIEKLKDRGLDTSYMLQDMEVLLNNFDSIKDIKKITTSNLATDKVNKIIDGEVTLFHASPETGIDKLKLSTPEAVSDIPGISFSSDLKYAKTFGDNIYKRTITPKNPLIIEEGTTLPKTLEKLGFKVEQGFNEEYLLNDIVKKQKWDVIIVKGSPDEIVVLDPKILKK